MQVNGDSSPHIQPKLLHMVSPALQVSRAQPLNKDQMLSSVLFKV